MAGGDTRKLTLEVQASVRDRLLEIAKHKGVGIGEVCLDAFEREIAENEINPVAPAPQPYDFDDLFAFRDYLLGDQFFPGDSVDIIREGRALRTIQIEES